MTKCLSCIFIIFTLFSCKEDSSIQNQRKSKVVDIYSTSWGFTALTDTNEAISWGGYYDDFLNSNENKVIKNVSKIQVINNVFIASRKDGSIVPWDFWHCTVDDCQLVGNLTPQGLKDLITVNGAYYGLMADGTVLKWKDLSTYTYGQEYEVPTAVVLKGISSLYTTGSSAGVALAQDGSVVAWGDPKWGGDCSEVSEYLNSGVVEIVQGSYAFAALKKDGSVVAWGNPLFGGDSSDVEKELSSGVRKIFTSGNAFAALKDNGSLVVWGHPNYGGDVSDVIEDLASGVKEVYSSYGSFFVVKEDGSIVHWNKPREDYVDLSQQKAKIVIKQVATTSYAFALLQKDGSVISWGYSPAGGDSSEIDEKLKSGVKKLISTLGAFMALKDDGSVVTWGDPYFGGDSSDVANQLQAGVKKIYTTKSSGIGMAVAALKENGTVVTWGSRNHGGDSSSIVSFLNP